MRVESLSFVYPVYNEGDNIEKVVAETVRIAPTLAYDYEIIIVDDASTDGSGEAADRLARGNLRIRVLHNKANRKLGGTLRTGFAAARKRYVLYMDSDLPIRMDDIPAAFSRLAGADMLIGYRANRHEGVKRAVLSWVYNRLIRLAFGLKVRDVNFSFKLFDRRILDVLDLRSEGSFIDAELLLETKRNGFRIAETGLDYYPRVAGVSTLAGPGIILTMLREMREYRARVTGLPRRATRPGLLESRLLDEDELKPGAAPALGYAYDEEEREPAVRAG